MLGHEVLGVFNFYAATKFAVTALTEGFRKELLARGSRIRITGISPGRTETNFLATAYGADKAKELYEKMESLQSQDVVDAVLYALGSAPHVRVSNWLQRKC